MLIGWNERSLGSKRIRLRAAAIIRRLGVIMSSLLPRSYKFRNFMREQRIIIIRVSMLQKIDHVLHPSALGFCISRRSTKRTEHLDLLTRACTICFSEAERTTCCHARNDLSGKSGRAIHSVGFRSKDEQASRRVSLAVVNKYEVNEGSTSQGLSRTSLPHHKSKRATSEKCLGLPLLVLLPD